MEVSRRYAEQFQTTVETMRRRGLAIYDLTVKLGARSAKLAERTWEACEPMAYDYRDHVLQACMDQEPVDLENRENRHNLLELYLALCVLTVGLGAGELMGAMVLSSVVECLFDTFIQLSLLVMLPSYVYLNFRKNAALDDTERRVWLFGMCLGEGILLGNLMGERLVNTVPGAFFVVPLVLGILADSEFSPIYVYTDRTRLIGFACAISGLLSLLLASFPLGHASFAVLLMSLLHVTLLFVHFQLVLASMKNKTFGNSEALIGYVMTLFVMQVVVGGVFGGASNAHKYSY